MVQELYELGNLTAMQSTLEVFKHLMKNHESLPRGRKLGMDSIQVYVSNIQTIWSKLIIFGLGTNKGCVSKVIKQF